jgi:flagellar protein FliS
MIASPLDRYRETDALTMSGSQQVVALYQALLTDLHRARRAFAAGQVAERTRALLHAQAVVEALAASVDLERGGAIAKGLLDLYAFFLRELLEVQVKAAPDRLERVIAMVAELHGAWVQAAATPPAP